MSETKKTVKVTLVKSPIGTGAKHRATLLGLGLKKLHRPASSRIRPLCAV